MKIRYTYKKYLNCPKATEYSQSAESTTAILGVIIGPVTLGAIFAIIYCSIDLFENYNVGTFIGGVCFSICVGLIDFFFFVCRPNNTDCEINIILLEESHYSQRKSALEFHTKKMRSENRKKNLKALKTFLIYYIPSLVVVISLVGTIYNDAFSLILLIISILLLLFLIIKLKFPDAFSNFCSIKFMEKYYSSFRYREKCYEKVSNMKIYLEKGIITQEEYEKNKIEILKHIK